MSQILINILMVLGSIALFLYGMKCSGEALQKMAGAPLRRLLATMTSTTPRRVAAGGIITMLLNSSSAVSVMAVSFVNAGLITLVQSIGLIMGANAGTVTTAWLISVFGFQLDLGLIAIPLIAIGFPMMLARREGLKSIGNIIVGLALLFLAIDILKANVASLGELTNLENFFIRISDGGVLSVLLFFAIGLILTVLVQSSSATITLTMTLCFLGWIPFSCGAAMILGENIGTTSTANMAAAMTNSDGKRAAFSHTLFNVVGVLWALPLLGAMTGLTSYIMTSLGGDSPFTAPQATPIALSLFHTLFNFINLALLVGFIPQMAALLHKIIPDNGKLIVADKLRYINRGILSAGDLSILQGQKELIDYARRSSRMFRNVRELFREHNTDNFNVIYQRIEQQETESDRTREELYEFLGRATRENIGASSKRNVAIMFRLVSDIEIMSDCNYSIAKLIRSKKERNIWFEPKLREGVNEMFDLIERAQAVMNHNLSAAITGIHSMEEALEVEQSINELRTRLREECLHTEQREESNYKAELIFSDLITRTEQLADIIIHISEDAMHLKGGNEAL